MVDEPKILDPQKKYDAYLNARVQLPTEEEYIEMLLMLEPYGVNEEEVAMADEETAKCLYVALSHLSPNELKSLLDGGLMPKGIPYDFAVERLKKHINEQC